MFNLTNLNQPKSSDTNFSQLKSLCKKNKIDEAVPFFIKAIKEKNKNNLVKQSMNKTNPFEKLNQINILFNNLLPIPNNKPIDFNPLKENIKDQKKMNILLPHF